MFRNLRHTSIRRKQTLIIMLTSSVVLLLACAAFIAYDTVAFRRDLIEMVAIQADTVGNNCAAAIDFNDPKSAEETLAALRANQSILLAAVYSKDGGVFAMYQRDRAGSLLPPAVAPAPGAQYTNDQLHLCRPIQQRAELMGTIFIVSDLKALSERLVRYASIEQTAEGAGRRPGWTAGGDLSLTPAGEASSSLPPGTSTVCPG